MKRIINYIKKWYKWRLFLKVYFAILNHNNGTPKDAFLCATEQFQGLMKILKGCNDA